ncbi:MAG: transposase [Paenibacillaceae bacterium]
MAIDHDRLFKELIQTYFREFIQLFFPQVYEEIDFEDLTFLSEEVFTDIVTGERRRVDLLVKTKLREEDVVIIIHIEAQSYYQRDYPERMFIYSSRLFEKYRCCILPIAIFSYDGRVEEEPSVFSWGLPFLTVMNYQFYTIELRKKNWRDFIKQDNPIAAALLSKMGYNKEEKVQVKKECLRMLLRLELDPARMYLILGFFDTYLQLNDKENQELKEELQMLDSKEGMLLTQLKTQWDIEAELRGETKGKLEEAHNFISKFIKAQFEEGNAELLTKIAALTDLNLLERLADDLFRVSRLEEVSRLVEEASKE